MRELILAVVGFLGVAAGQQTIELKSAFDIDAEGWTCVGAAVEYRQSGGNPGGYLFVDPFERDILSECTAPAQFRGDLSAFDGGTLSFDGNMMVAAAPDW